MAKLNGIPSPLEVARTCAQFNVLQPLVQRPFLPTKLVIYVTYRCNSCCTMCGIWEAARPVDLESELSPANLDCILADPLFSKVQHLNLNGGEPTVREDLVDLVEVAIRRLPRLRWISMNSNGFLTEQLVPAAERLLRICATHGISYSLILSMHGVGPAADRISGIQGTFDRQVTSVRALQSLGPAKRQWLSLLCVISRASWPSVNKLLGWSQEMKLPLTFAVAEIRDRFRNLHKADQITLTEQQRQEVVVFLRELARSKRPSPSAYRYHQLANLMQVGQKRTMACHYAMGGVILGSRGEIFYCPHSKLLGNSQSDSAHDIYYDPRNLAYRRSALIDGECLHCPPYTFDRQEFSKDLFRYLKFILF